MKIIAFSSATLVSLFPLEAFTPLGGINERHIIDAIGQRYNFSTSPNLSSRAEVKKTGLVFEWGFFTTETGEVTIDRLAIHNDGVVVRAYKTEQARAFFDDLTNWLVEQHKCRKITHTPHYLSEVVVDFDRPASNILANYDKIIDIIISNVSENREVSGATFGALTIDFLPKSVAVTPKFMIERFATGQSLRMSAPHFGVLSAPYNGKSCTDTREDRALIFLDCGSSTVSSPPSERSPTAVAPSA